MIDSWNIQLQSFTPEHDHICGVCGDGNERATSGLWSYLWAHYDASFRYRSSHYRLTQTAINNRKSLIPNHPPDMELLLASGLYGYKSFKNVPHEFAITGAHVSLGNHGLGINGGWGSEWGLTRSPHLRATEWARGCRLRWITAIGCDEIAKNTVKVGFYVYGGEKICMFVSKVWMHVCP